MSTTRWFTARQAPRLHEEDTWFYFTCVHCGEHKSGYDIERCFKHIGPECRACLTGKQDDPFAGWEGLISNT